MASRASPALEGRVTEHQRKANNISQPTERDINDSNRLRGRGETSGRDPYRSRPSDRSPSPFRRKRSRSPSPYQKKPVLSRSPSPYRHGRGSGASRDDKQSQVKRKASPPRNKRPDKRQHFDRNMANGRRPDSQRQEHHAGSRASLEDSHRAVKPLSYADHEHTAPLPGFGNAFGDFTKGQHGFASRPSGQGTSSRENIASQQRDTQSGQAVPIGDVEMTSPTTDTAADDQSMSQDQTPAQESREEKRRRWAAIRAAADKEKTKENLLQQAVLANAGENLYAVASPSATIESFASPIGSPRSGHLDSVPASPDMMIVDKEQTLSAGTSPAADGTSAADYDPTRDMLDDRDRAAQKVQASELPSEAYQETDSKALSTLPAAKIVPVKKQKKDFDMFDFDEDEDAEEESVEEQVDLPAKGTILDEKLLDNWDDSEGYYKIISNELVNDGRYRMIKLLGRGVFANVAQAEDVQAKAGSGTSQLVAVKMIRRNDLMRKASQQEMDTLRKVNDEDPQDRRHIIRLIGSFDHKGHLCVVFEHMSKNLRDLLKEDTNGHGLSLQAVRTYSRQMFIGLHHLQNCQIVHCDLKPDNILVSSDKKTIKLCDFGTAVDKRDVMDRTEYLVSRFYRAPEIILGMELGYGIDMWAIGCTAYELWTGKILFTGRTNNQMVKSFMDCLGWPTEKLLKKGLFENITQHFEAGPPLKFVSREIDPNGKATTRLIEQQKKIPRDLKTRVNDAARGIAQDGPTTTELNDFADLLGACLNMNVEKRLQPKEALLHKFFPQQKMVPRPSVMKPSMMKRNLMNVRR